MARTKVVHNHLGSPAHHAKVLSRQSFLSHGHRQTRAQRGRPDVTAGPGGMARASLAWYGEAGWASTKHRAGGFLAMGPSSSDDGRRSGVGAEQAGRR